MIVSLAVGGLLWLAMVAASGWGAAVLPAGARIAIHCGSTAHCYRAAKPAGLIAWPVIGAVLLGGLGATARSSLAADWVPGFRDVLVPAVLVVALGFQAGALLQAGQQQ
jgi:hypothetical protein